MASETNASQTFPKVCQPTTTLDSRDLRDIDDGLISSQRLRYLTALQQEQVNQPLEDQSDSPRPEP
jgi:hypothetical protein